MAKDPFKIICYPLNAIISIKVLTPKQQKEIYKNLRDQVNQGSFISIVSYVRKLIQLVVVDAPRILETIDSEELDIETEAVLFGLYDSILHAYSVLRMENVCGDVNSRLMNEVLLTELGASDKKEIGMPGAISLSQIKKLDRSLKRRVVGQRAAIKALNNQVTLLASGLYKRGNYFFLGPTGVGKSLVATTFGKYYSGHFYKINCAEFAQGHEFHKLLGGIPGYVGYVEPEKSILGSMAKKSKRWVILFDEIEKAHPKLYDFMLSLLDDGTLTDNAGNVLDFSESVIVCSSNVGADKLNKKLGFTHSSLADKIEENEDLLRAEVEREFSPEFINRFDQFIIFDLLSQEQVKDVAKLELEGIPIEVTSGLMDFISEEGYSEKYGARFMSKFIKREVGVPVSHAIVSNLIPKKGKFYQSKIKDNKVVIINTKEDVGLRDLKKRIKKKPTKGAKPIIIKRKSSTTKKKAAKKSMGHR